MSQCMQHMYKAADHHVAMLQLLPLQAHDQAAARLLIVQVFTRKTLLTVCKVTLEDAPSSQMFSVATGGFARTTVAIKLACHCFSMHSMHSIPDSAAKLPL